MNKWLLAVKPASMPKVLLPLAAGLSVALYDRSGAPIEIPLIIISLLYGIFIQLYIVFLNDAADADADELHSRKYPENFDPRVIPLKLFSRRFVFIIAALSAFGAFILSLLLLFSFDRPAAPLICGLSLLLLIAYSLPPIRLNYRGAGEVLESVGVGIMLPVSGFYFYSGRFDSAYIPLLVPLFLLSLAGAVSSGIKHIPADIENGKKTAAVIIGEIGAKLIISLSLFASIVSTLVLHYIGHLDSFASSLTILLPTVLFVLHMTSFPSASHERLKPLKEYKSSLHFAMYSLITGICVSYLLRFAL